MRHLADAGLTTREACGNSVRNITSCPHAGVARDEVFDVTPYAEAMTRYLLRHPLSSALPRKFKIAFEGCTSEDHAATSINDLGWRAMMAPDGSGRRGFRVQVAGGTAIMCRIGRVALRVPARVRHPDGRRSGAARVPALRRLRAQAAEPPEVPRQVDGMGRVARGVPAASSTMCARPAARSCRSIPRTRRSRHRRRANGLHAPSIADITALVTASCGQRPGHRSGGAARLTAVPGASAPSGCGRTCGRRSRASTRRSPSRSCSATSPPGRCARWRCCRERTPTAWSA